MLRQSLRHSLRSMKRMSSIFSRITRQRKTFKEAKKMKTKSKKEQRIPPESGDKAQRISIRSDGNRSKQMVMTGSTP